jgi:spore germination protein YaaH
MNNANSNPVSNMNNANSSILNNSNILNKPDEKKYNTEDMSLTPKSIQPITSMSELTTSNESDQTTAIEVKNMSDRLDKTLKEMRGDQVNNNKQQTQLNQTMISTNQNNVMSNQNNYIPEENKYTGIGILNGAMM